MKHLYLLIKPASSLCNMRCAYCFYHDLGEHRASPSFGIMKRDTAEKIIKNIHKELEEGGEITINFQGGEPTLAGLSWFEYFVRLMESERNIKVNWTLQTNGLLIDRGWAEFLKKHDFLTGLSIDAVSNIHNRVRRTSNNEGSFDACLKAKAALEEQGAEFNILCVLTNELAAHPDKVWRFIIKEQIRFIQFIPCLEELDGKGHSPYPLKPARFAHFYIRLYYLWMKELEKKNYYSVKFFDDTVNWFFRGVPISCGIDGRCHAQYVVEADGSVYPCDFYALDKYNTGNLTEHTLKELFDSPAMQAFLGEERKLPELCGACGYGKYCNGGCKRMNQVMYFGTPGSPAFGSVCGYKMFLDKCLGPLEHTAKRYFSFPR